MMGIFVGSAVMPIAFVLTWDKATAQGAITGVCRPDPRHHHLDRRRVHREAPSGDKGVVSIDTLGMNYPMLAGNVVAILSSGLICAIVSKSAPQNFDFSTMASKIALIDDKMPELDAEENDPQMLKDALTFVQKWGVGFTVLMVIVWPSLPSAGCGASGVECGVFSKGYFYLWVSVAIAWGIVATAVIIIMPLYESMDGINLVFKGVMTNDDVHMSRPHRAHAREGGWRRGAQGPLPLRRPLLPRQAPRAQAQGVSERHPG